MSSQDLQIGLAVDELAEKVGGRYRLTRLVSLRLRQVNAGSPLLVEQGPNESLLAAVCREIAEEKISLDVPEETEGPEEAAFDLLGLGEEGES